MESLFFRFSVRKYIKEQEKDDIAKDKLSVKEYEDSFGEDKTVRKSNKQKQVVNDLQ